jgi:hypothetical protein
MSSVPTNNTCDICAGLRGLSLHLHELASFCDYLDNRRITYVRKKGALIPDQEASTAVIAGWLRLASQIERVDLDTYQFQEAHIYCEPVNEQLRSDAEHHSLIATPLTRFVFFCNALEETYRFISPAYEKRFDRRAAGGMKEEYLRSHSMQATLILDERKQLSVPYGYQHLTENLLKISQIYFRQFGGTLDVGGRLMGDQSYGLQLVRNVRNHVAHGVFPLLENPEYSMNADRLTRRNTINLLNQCTRIGAISIQLLLAADNDGFQSILYGETCDDFDYGNYFSENMNREYLINLHLSQDFGLNESAYFQWSELAGT